MEKYWAVVGLRVCPREGLGGRGECTPRTERMVVKGRVGLTGEENEFTCRFVLGVLAGGQVL